VSIVRRGVIPTVMLLDPVSFGGAGSMSGVSVALRNLGVTSYDITKDLLDRPEVRPGRRGHTEWRALGTGKAIAVKQDENMAWRSLA